MTSSSSLTSVSRSETPNPRYELDSVGWHSRQGGDIRERHRAISKPRDENRRTAGSPIPAREHRQRGVFFVHGQSTSQRGTQLYHGRTERTTRRRTKVTDPRRCGSKAHAGAHENKSIIVVNFLGRRDKRNFGFLVRDERSSTLRGGARVPACP